MQSFSLPFLAFDVKSVLLTTYSLCLKHIFFLNVGLMFSSKKADVIKYKAYWTEKIYKVCEKQTAKVINLNCSELQINNHMIMFKFANKFCVIECVCTSAPYRYDIYRVNRYAASNMNTGTAAPYRISIDCFDDMYRIDLNQTIWSTSMHRRAT